MTEEEYAAALAQVKLDVKVYINDPDPVKSARAIQILVSALIGNAGSYENLAMVKAALVALIG